MLVTLSDLVSKCPLQNWSDHRHTIEIKLLEGQSLVYRFTLKDLKGFSCTADTLKCVKILQNDHDAVREAIANLVNDRLLLVAQDQLEIAKLTNAILGDISEGTLTAYFMIPVADHMMNLLAPYEPHATLAGWAYWLRLCESYLELQKPGKIE